MRNSLMVLVAVAVLVAGCRKTPPAAPAAAAKPATPARPDAAQVAASVEAAKKLLAKDDKTVLVTVNGRELALGEAKKEIEARTSAMAARVPPAQMEDRKAQMLWSVIDQFTMRSLLLDEAQRRKIEVTPEDEKTAFDKIRKQLPPDKTLEQVMKESPVGEARMREEVLVGIRINKLLEQVIPKNMPVSEQDIAQFKQDNAEAKPPEMVAARHILIKVAETDDEKTKQAKRAKIDGLRQQLMKGAVFAEVARQSSECPSAARGGDLGVFRRGQMVKAFEDAAFAQKPGDIGEVVETKFGYHLILVESHTQEGEYPRKQLVQLLQTRKSKEAYESFVKSLRDQAKVKYGEGVKATL